MVGGLLVGVAVTLAAPAARGVVITVGSATGQPGEQVSVAVSLATEGSAVLATQNQLTFGRQAYVAAGEDGAPLCAVDPAIDKEATAFRFLPLGCDPALDCSAVRVFVLSFGNLTPIADGAVLYTCAVAIAADAAPGEYPIGLAELGASAAMGVLLPVSGSPGAVSVTIDLEPVAEVQIGAVTGAPGDTVMVETRLALLDAAAEVAGVQVELAFTAAAPVAATGAGAPDCELGDELGGGGQNFAFLPSACTPGLDCQAVRAIVLPLGSSEPLADGALLFSCRVAIAADAAPGVYALTAGELQGSGPDGGRLPLRGADGAVTVELPPPPPCPGDCDASGDVSINELLLGVNILLGSTAAAECPAIDAGADGEVSISDLILAVNVALGACPA